MMEKTPLTSANVIRVVSFLIDYRAHAHSLPYDKRRFEVSKERDNKLRLLLKSKKITQYRQTKKSFNKEEPYLHLSYTERCTYIKDVASYISGQGVARLFAECIDKNHFDPSRGTANINEQAFEQVISRFQQYLKVTSNDQCSNCGLIIHDNNATVAKKHTEMMKKFYQQGTLWTNLENIIETPFFVDSELTSMIQIADLCAYALRRYLENNEEELFDLIFKRADRKDDVVVGVRHFTKLSCSCKICESRRRPTV